MKFLNWIPLVIWMVANFTGVGVLAFVDNSALRFISWIWISFAITISGLVEVGGVFYRNGKSDAGESELDAAMKALMSKKENTHGH